MIEMKTFIERFIGLMFRKVDNNHYVFRNCRSVHTMFMLETIDVLGLNMHMIVVDKKRIKPYKFICFNKTVVHVVEAKHTNYKIGDKICVRR